jgi:adenylate cyclase
MKGSDSEDSGTELLEEFRAFLILASEKLLLPLFPLFWVADLFYVPDHRWLYLFLRLSVVPFCIFIGRISRAAKTYNATELYGLLLVSYPSLVITYMAFRIDDVTCPYYAGLNLIAAAVVCFFPWRTRNLILGLLIIYGPFIISTLSRLSSFDQLRYFVVNVFFIAGSIIISFVTRSLYRRLKDKERLLRNSLGEEIASRGRTIEQKTNEAISLNSLTKQFSPQIVKAIQSGQIRLNTEISRAKICVIYIDVVGFTAKVNILDHKKVDLILTMFMEDVIKIFLKYDLTIDKFIGDCALAFSNEPVKYSDYIERPVRAALEVKKILRDKAEVYSSLWQGPFEVRTGIDSSYAGVGFYGSDKYFKSFTAIGRAMNLANRICSSANAGQILISDNVATELNLDDFGLLALDERKFKGFGESLFKIWEVNENAVENRVFLPTQDCPKCGNTLHLDSNINGIFILKCRECGVEVDEVFPLNPNKRVA